MNKSILPLVNAVGCLILTIIVIILWRYDYALSQELRGAHLLNRDTQVQLKAESERAQRLERDIAALKESLVSSQEAAEKMNALNDDKDDDKDALNQKLELEVHAAREQISAWQAAILERDTKLRQLSEELTNTRKRLDTAIVKLKAAAPSQ